MTLYLWTAKNGVKETEDSIGAEWVDAVTGSLFCNTNRTASKYWVAERKTIAEEFDFTKWHVASEQETATMKVHLLLAGYEIPP